MRRVTVLLCLVVLVLAIQAPMGRAHAQTADALSSEFDYDNFPPEQQQEVKTEQETDRRDAEDTAASGLDDTNVTLVMAQIVKEAVVVISLAVMAVTSLYFVLSTLYRRDSTPRDIIGGSGLVVIVYGTIILTLTVSTEQQLTAAAGILGAIAGYLFGTTQRSEVAHVPAGAAATHPAPANPESASPAPGDSPRTSPPRPP